MGQHTYPKKVVEEFFRSRGLVYKRSNDSHDLWDYPDDSLIRKCTLKTTFKEVPITHIHTNCVTLGLQIKDFKNWLKHKK